MLFSNAVFAFSQQRCSIPFLLLYHFKKCTKRRILDGGRREKQYYAVLRFSFLHNNRVLFSVETVTADYFLHDQKHSIKYFQPKNKCTSSGPYFTHQSEKGN